MPIKVEDRSSIKIPKIEEQINLVIDCVPVEHLRGFTRIVLVDTIEDAPLPREQTEKLPALYRPKTPGMSSAFGEIAVSILVPKANPLKRLGARAQLRAIVAQRVLTLVAQHYLITLKSGKKRGGEIERAAREY